MNEYYYSLFILSLFSNFQYSLLDKNFEKNLPNITIRHVCENDLLLIKCLNINETIQIIRSMYGRTSQRICNNDFQYRFFDKTCANIRQSNYQTKLRCHGKSTCQILINNQIFTDPCGSNISKHFEIHYRCIDKKKMCSKLFLNCSKFNDLKCIEKLQQEYSCQCPSTICQYINKQIVGFTKDFCQEEYLQGFHWKENMINQSQYLSCPSPCTGQVYRFCNSNRQWSKVNYTNCQCPIKQYDQLSIHRSASRYVFQCNFWLINRILPQDNSCIVSFANWNKKLNESNSYNCLINAFEQMTFQSCLRSSSFGINFQNLAFEIYIPMKNENQFHLLSNKYDLKLQNSFNQIIINRTNIIKENFHLNLPMMIIDTKFLNEKNQSIILIEQKYHFNSIRTANVTVIFNHQSSEFAYQCRAYHSTNFSSHIDSTNMFFACQFLCSNESHVICQCPFFNPLMHYTLHIDTSKTENAFMIDYKLNGKCFEEEHNSINEKLNKLDRYMKNVSSLNFAKKLFLFIDKIIENEINWENLYQIIKRIELLGLQLLNQSSSFTSISNHIEFFIKTKRLQLENTDQSVSVSIKNKLNQNFINIQTIFFTISNINVNQSLNSRIVSINFMSKFTSIDNIQIIFRHLNETNQRPICAHLKTLEIDNIQWSTDGCQLLSTNLTHSICLFNHLNTFALFMNNEQSNIKYDEYHLLFMSKIGCLIAIICLLLTTIILLHMRFRTHTDDDLTVVRRTLHINMLLSLTIVQISFLFGIDRTKHKFGCQIISILIDYFLLTTFSWMFVDGIELLIALKQVLKIDRIRLIAYSLCSYGFPVLIVLFSITLTVKNPHDPSLHCWPSHDNTYMWTFIIPFILLTIGNLCFFIISIYYICKRLNSTDHINKIRYSLCNISTMSILFGLTWIIAFCYLYYQTVLLAYLFTIFNSFHGLLILLFYILLQEHFQNSFRKFHFYKKYPRSMFQHCIRTSQCQNHIHQKSIEHFSLSNNTSSSDYSSAHSADLNHKQTSCNQIRNLSVNNRNYLPHHISFQNHYDRRFCANKETPYLSSIPISLLTNRLSTFRYPLPSHDVILSYEQNEQLLRKNQIHEDDHQYYEIG